MSTGSNGFDAIAHALVDASNDFDAVEDGTLRAEWSEDGREVVVTDGETGERVVYSADDLAVATSDREVENARQTEV